MFQKELLTIGFLAMALLVAVGAAGWVAVAKLHETSRFLVIDTLPGLMDTGLAEQRIHDGRHLMREMLFPHTDAERAEMISAVLTNRTDDLWQDYSHSLFEPEDASNYAAMMIVRSNYLSGVPAYLDLVRAGNLPAATTLYYGDLQQGFNHYEAACRGLFDYSVRQGQDRGRIILAATSVAPVAIGALCVLLFLCGLAAGMRVALGRRPGARVLAGKA